MRVYRVECAHGDGPYRGPNKIVRMCKRHNGHEKRPSPMFDGLVVWDLPVSFVCGFNDVITLKAWFRGWPKQLRQAGFAISVYTVPQDDVRVGERQIMFDTKKAKYLSCISF